MVLGWRRVIHRFRHRSGRVAGRRLLGHVPLRWLVRIALWWLLGISLGVLRIPLRCLLRRITVTGRWITRRCWIPGRRSVRVSGLWRITGGWAVAITRWRLRVRVARGWCVGISRLLRISGWRLGGIPGRWPIRRRFGNRLWSTRGLCHRNGRGVNASWRGPGKRCCGSWENRRCWRWCGSHRRCQRHSLRRHGNRRWSRHCWFRDGTRASLP